MFNEYISVSSFAVSPVFPITLHLLTPLVFISAIAVNKSFFIGIAFVTVHSTFILLPLFPVILNT